MLDKALLEELGGNPALREKLNEWMGRPPNYTAPKDGLPVRIKTASLEGVIFEWHPQARKVYYIEVDAAGKPKNGQAFIIAWNVETHGDAINYIHVWLRGYEKGQSPKAPQLRMAEGG